MKDDPCKVDWNQLEKDVLGDFEKDRGHRLENIDSRSRFQKWVDKILDFHSSNRVDHSK